jgi:hypothetical protein
MYFPTSEVAPAPNIGNNHRIFAANKALNLRKSAGWGKPEFHYRWARRDTDRKQVNGVVQLIR